MTATTKVTTSRGLRKVGRAAQVKKTKMHAKM
jgi:hypothetical protein